MKTPTYLVDDFVEMLRLDQEGMEQALEISEIKKKNQEDGDGFVSTKIREHALMSRLLKNPSVVGCDSLFFFCVFPEGAGTTTFGGVQVEERSGYVSVPCLRF